MRAMKILLLLSPVFSWAAPAERGLITQQYKSPSGVIEQCIVTKRIPNWPNQKKKDNEDIQKEAELCEFNFYSENGSSAVGVCPKLNSTNPGVLLYSTKENSKSQLEDELCKQDNVDAKLLAKFKQSVSCSYTPSILAYYQFSKILETPEVPRAVVRTMDIETHKQIRQDAIATLRSLGKGSKTIYTTWNNSWGLVYNNPRSERGVRAITPDGQQVYGALSENPSHEIRYKEVYGAWKDYDLRFDSFRAQAPYKKIIDARSVEEIAGNVLAQDSLQTRVQMKDVSDMLLIDYILGQQDRPGNIHYQNVIYYSADGKKWSHVKSHKAEKEQAKINAAKFRFNIKKMIMKDNDCGVIKGNATREHGLLNDLSHMDPATYKNIGQLVKLWTADTAAADSYLKDELLFTDKDVTTVKSDLFTLFELLQERCRSGRLQLDLDVKSFLEGTTKSATSCEIE